MTPTGNYQPVAKGTPLGRYRECLGRRPSLGSERGGVDPAVNPRGEAPSVESAVRVTKPPTEEAAARTSVAPPSRPQVAGVTPSREHQDQARAGIPAA